MNLQERFLAKSSEIVSSITLGSSFFQNQSAFKIRSLIEIFGNDFFVKMHLNFLWERERYNINWFFKKKKNGYFNSNKLNNCHYQRRGHFVVERLRERLKWSVGVFRILLLFPRKTWMQIQRAIISSCQNNSKTARAANFFQ